MSLGSDFIGGFSAVQDVKARKAKLAQDERLSQADAQLRRDLMQKQIDSDVQRMREGFGHSSSEAEKNRAYEAGESRAKEMFGASESAKERALRLSLQNNGQAFEGSKLDRQQVFIGGQNDKDRMLRQIENDAANAARNRHLDILAKQLEQKAAAGAGNQYDKPPVQTAGMGTGNTPPLGNTPPDAPKGPGMWDRVKAGAANLGQSWRTSSPFGAAFDAAHNAERNMMKAPALPALTTMEGKIVNDPSGKRYRVINGQNVPVDQ